MQSSREFEGDAGAPLPDFSAAGTIDIRTIAPALGINAGARQPDYLDYDQKGRGIVVSMFANSGVAYLIGTFGGGLYGLREGILNSPSTRFRVKLNSILNHCGRHGSKWGNSLGVVAILYSLYEGAADQVSLYTYVIVIVIVEYTHVYCRVHESGYYMLSVQVLFFFFVS
jgi:hypothetical protein